MNIRYPIYEGVYRILTHYGHYHFLEHFIIYIHHGMYLLYFLKVTTEIPPVRTVRVYTILL